MFWLFFSPTVCIWMCVCVPVIWTDMLRGKLAIKFYCKGGKKNSIWLRMWSEVPNIWLPRTDELYCCFPAHIVKIPTGKCGTHTHLCVLTLERLRLRGFWLLKPTLLDRRRRLNGLIHTEASLCCFWSGALVAVDGLILYCCAHRCPYSCN